MSDKEREDKSVIKSKNKGDLYIALRSARMTSGSMKQKMIWCSSTGRRLNFIVVD